MKVCKKCKRHVANKIKICKYCGADVSKAKIIKNGNVKKVNSISKKVAPIVQKNNNVKLYTDSSNKKTNNLKNSSKKEKRGIFGLKNSESKKLFKGSIFLKTDKRKKERKKFFVIKNFFDRVCGFKREKKLSFFERIKALIVRKINFKILLLVFVLSVIFALCLFYGMSFFDDVTDNSGKVALSEEATNNKIFGIGDLIDYNGVQYKVAKVETSEGNYYKRPSEGNQFLVVTVYISNNTDARIPYSYKNFTMSNSLGEETKRIFTSINVEDALYSGELVIGGIKRGSMVFEQPKNDPKLRLNFYKLKKDKNGDDVIDYQKKVFSVSIKIPKEDKNKKVVSTSNKLDNSKNKKQSK